MGPWCLESRREALDTEYLNVSGHITHSREGGLSDRPASKQPISSMEGTKLFTVRCVGPFGFLPSAKAT